MSIKPATLVGMKKIAKIATTLAALFVTLLVFAPIVSVEVTVGHLNFFILSSGAAHVSVSFLYFGFGYVYVTSSLWRNCSGFYWNHDMADCIVTIT
ncbi:MAG: hypothetical protein ACYC7D_09505 [Nitrososphaerales archaeon]